MTAEIQCTSYMIDFELEAGVKNPPKWARTAMVADDLSAVFLPAALCAVGEEAAFMCASYDGEPCCLLDGHCYLRYDWMLREYPIWAIAHPGIKEKVDMLLAKHRLELAHA